MRILDVWCGMRKYKDMMRIDFRRIRVVDSIAELSGALRAILGQQNHINV